MRRVIACARCGLRLERVRSRTIVEKFLKRAFDLERAKCPKCKLERFRKRARRHHADGTRAELVLLMLAGALLAFFLASSGKFDRAIFPWDRHPAPHASSE